MDNLDKVTEDIKNKYPDLGIKKIEVGSDGKASFYMQPKRGLPFLADPYKAMSFRKEVSSTIRRTPIDKSMLDLASKTSVVDTDPKELFSLANKYYKENPIVGAATNLLVFLTTKGFENDIDDEEIKKFFDVWAYDIGLRTVIGWIATDLVKIGHVFVYKNTAPYTKRESKISSIPGVSLGKIDSDVDITSLKNKLVADIIKEIGSKVSSKEQLMLIEKAAGKVGKKATEIPVAYTVLNPSSVTVEGSMFLNATQVVMTAPDDLKALLNKSSSELTKAEKELIKKLPNDFKKQIQDSGKVVLDQDSVTQITYMKQPYERYATPRLARTLESLAYKQALVNADLSTLDGISNYILKITIGNDEYPVESQAELDAVAKLFNTPSKSFDVVWNHTLKVEKIVSPEIGAILGKSKYEQVEDDISAGIAVMRALIDGKGANIGGSQMGLLLKGLAEEINYLRAVITEWIYKEYATIAEVVGFDKFPRIRWDDSILKDTILYMTVLSQLVDRRMLSYRTAHESLGFDYSTELNNMKNEIDLVSEGIFGLKGSPWQQSTGIQPNQGAPTGTPSDGRPKAKPTTKKKAKDGTDVTSNTSASLESIKSMSDSDFINLVHTLDKIRKGDIKIDV